MTGTDDAGTGTGAPPSPQAAALLACLESGRDRAARRIVRDIPAVTDPDLNYLTVSFLLQVLFLKAGQEWGFVKKGTLAALAGCDRVAQRMGRACSDAGLDPELFFEKGPDGPRALPGIPDELLREIIVSLDAPDIPAPGAQLPPEELAAVLDRFLATRLQVGEGYRVVRAGKSALLYTGTVDVPPQQEAEHVAETAIRGAGPGPVPRDTQPFRVLDPACGAGLFLLAALRALVRNDRGRGEREPAPADLRAALCASVFGTDIDPESVSAARLVLLLAFLEESRKSSAGLPGPGPIAEVCRGLAGTIRCGNALIAPDYFTGKPIFPFNADERRRVNAFDWQAAFPAAAAAGGFDAVIGSPPPYRPFAVKAREEYFQTHYDAYAPSAGLYGYFIERGLSLLRPGGTLAFLVPGTFLRSQHARPLRRLLLARQIGRIACTGRTRLLTEGDAPIYLLVLKNRPPGERFTVSPVFFPGRNDFLFDQHSLDDGGWRLEDTRTADILEKIRARGTLLEEYVLGEIEAGTVRDNPLVVDGETRKRLCRGAWWARRFFVPLLSPEEIRRYVPVRPARSVIAVADRKEIRKCRALHRYLEGAADIAGSCISSGNSPDEPCAPAEPFPETISGNIMPEQRKKKIVFARYQPAPAFSFDPGGRYAIASTLEAIPRNDPYLLAILNSALGRFVITHTCPFTDRGYHLSPAALGKFPVMVPDFESLAERKRHDRIVALVRQLLSLGEYLQRAASDQERRLVQQEIDATDVRIDALVYEMYGLTPEEIAVVETSSS